jgi:ubiquinone/menaquinone biosynthesis C-methylase UbiE
MYIDFITMLILVIAVAIIYKLCRTNYKTGGYSWKTKVDVYDKYRPSYLAVQKAIDYTGLNISDITIADIGSGTGILTEQIHNMHPLKLYAVEPDIDMLNILIKKIPDITHIKGTSDNTKIPSNSIDIITIGTAIHWFEPISTIKEFKRILKSGGYVISFRNSYTLKNSDIMSEHDDKCNKLYLPQSGLKRYKWDFAKFDSVEVYERDIFKHLSLSQYVGEMMSQSRAPDAHSVNGKKYIKILTSLFNKYRPISRKTTRATIFKL